MSDDEVYFLRNHPECGDVIGRKITQELADCIYEHKDQILEIKNAEDFYSDCVDVHRMPVRVVRVRMVVPDVLCKDCVMYDKENMYCNKYNELRKGREFCSKGLQKRS